MGIGRISPIILAFFLLVTPSVLGEEVRHYEQDGIRWRETRKTVRRPLVETQMKDVTQTVYRERWETECRETVRTYWTPVTENRCEAVWIGRWNPFVQPRLEYRPVLRTRWEQRTEVVKTPVTCRRLVPETQTVRVPVTSQRFVEEEVISRIALGPSSSTRTSSVAGTPTLAPAEPIGGMARLKNDPPRHGVSTAWRPSNSAHR